jgi:GPH family glycoside/pentoside/hexuronide:cation symporter
MASFGALSALPGSMAADIVDIDTLTSGQQRAGAYFAIGGMIGKGVTALGLFIGTSLAVLGGFDQLADPVRTTNTAASLLWLACLYSVIPALFKFVAMPFLWTWPLTEERLAEIQKEIYDPSST